MADSVLLAGAAARMEFTAGTANIDFSPITMVCVVKATSASTFYSIMVGQTGFYRLGFNDTDEIFSSDGTTDNMGGPVITTTNWNLVGITHTGVGAPEYHHYNGTSWSHPAAAGASLAAGSAATRQDISESGGDALQGNILITGIKDSVMTNPQIEALSAGYAAWVAAGFLEGVRFDAASGLATYTAGSSSQGTTVGASLDTGDVPSWWTDTAGDTGLVIDWGAFPKEKMRR